MELSFEVVCELKRSGKKHGLDESMVLERLAMAYYLAKAFAVVGKYAYFVYP